jgi:hypothetical protein
VDDMRSFHMTDYVDIAFNNFRNHVPIDVRSSASVGDVGIYYDHHSGGWYSCSMTFCSKCGKLLHSLRFGKTLTATYDCQGFKC